MNPESYERLQSLFLEVRELSGEKRSDFLRQVGVSEPELREPLQALLAADVTEDAEGFLKRPMAELADAATPMAHEASLQGSFLGPYKILKRLDRGGMGTVYLAVRSDEVFHKRFAIKILAGTGGARDLERRFQTERQILAALDHPNISRLVDGGTSPDDRPYLVMEFVEGQALDVYCAHQKLGITDRIRLVCAVCEAVQFAHSNLVVHRDLKPQNILVTADGAVKLLDFGIAKLLNPELASSDELTGSAHLRYTPRYASPEQVRGEPVTAATDIYALGVILYELLSGHSPYRSVTGAAAELIDEICFVEPDPMSVAALRRETTPAVGTRGHSSPPPDLAPRELSRRLAGDLDAIVLRALRKRPRVRYPSVGHFADDLRRYLDSYPVRARNSTPGYRLGKFVRRHFWPLAAATVLLLSSAAVAIYMVRQSAHLQAAHDHAEAQTDRAESVIRFLQELFEISDPEGGAEPELTARKMLLRGAERVTRELGDEPEVQARLQVVIGSILSRLGELEDAEPILEASLETRRNLSGDHELDIAESLSHLGSLRIHQGEYPEAQSLFEEALQEQRQRLGTAHLEIATTLAELGLVALHRDEPERARELLVRALSMNRNLSGDELERAAIMDLLASLSAHRGDVEEASRLYQEALEIRRDRLGAQDILVSETENNLAVLLAVHGGLDEALALYESALQTRRRVYGVSHPRVATTMHNMAGVLRDLGNLGAAESMYREAIESYEKSLGHDHRYTAGSLLRLANLLEEAGRLAEAQAAYLEVVAILDRVVDANHSQRGEALLYLARFRLRVGQTQRASELASEASEILSKTLPGHWRVAAAQAVRAGCLLEMGIPERAAPLLREGLARLREESDRRAVPFRQTAEEIFARLPSVSPEDI